MIKRTLKRLLILIPFMILFASIPAQGFSSEQEAVVVQSQTLAKRELPLGDRYAVPSVNTVFANNILLTLSYLSGKVNKASDIDWAEVKKSNQFEITLQPGEVFAFHDDVLPEFRGKHVISTRAHFNAQEGFLSDGYLYGDGVCHLASVINWAARDAGLSVTAPTNHDFANVPDVPRQYGTAIYYNPGDAWTNEHQNLYVENTLDKPVHIVFDSSATSVVVTVTTDK